MSTRDSQAEGSRPPSTSTPVGPGAFLSAAIPPENAMSELKRKQALWPLRSRRAVSASADYLAEGLELIPSTGCPYSALVGLPQDQNSPARDTYERIADMTDGKLRDAVLCAFVARYAISWARKIQQLPVDDVASPESAFYWALMLSKAPYLMRKALWRAAPALVNEILDMVAQTMSLSEADEGSADWNQLVEVVAWLTPCYDVREAYELLGDDLIDIHAGLRQPFGIDDQAFARYSPQMVKGSPGPQNKLDWLLRGMHISQGVLAGLSSSHETVFANANRYFYMLKTVCALKDCAERSADFICGHCKSRAYHADCARADRLNHRLACWPLVVPDDYDL